MRSIIALLIAAIMATTSAHAGSPCPTSVGDVRPISLESRDMNYLAGLQVSLLLGLSPSSFPYDQVTAQGDVCARGEFDAAGDAFRGYGRNEDSPPRWAAGSNPQRIVYLAVIPPPSAALEWARNRGASDNTGPSFSGSPLYVLAITNGALRDIFAIFEAIPGDDQLTSSFRDALEGRLPRLATFDERTGQTAFETH